MSLTNFLANSLAFLVIAEVLPGFEIASWSTALIMALIYAGLYTFIGLPVLVLMLAPFVLTPIIGWLLLPLAALLLSFCISMAVLTVTDGLMTSFAMASGGTAFIAALLLAVLNAILTTMLRSD